MRQNRALVVLLVCAAAAGCAGGARYYSKQVAVAPPPLDHSVFPRDPQGQLAEEDLQRILDSPIELDLPARVGVMPIVPARDWRGPAPTDAVPAGVAEFVKALRASDHFTLVTEMMAIPSGSLGMEALRELAARYRLRYVVMYREHFERKSRLNEWAWGYVTLLGALFLPGETLHVAGYLEASFFDVKTGLFLFTVRRAVGGSKWSNIYHQPDKLAAMERTLAVKFAPALAQDLKRSTGEFAQAARIENERRVTRATPPAPPAGPATPATQVATP